MGEAHQCSLPSPLLLSAAAEQCRDGAVCSWAGSALGCGSVQSGLEDVPEGRHWEWDVDQQLSRVMVSGAAVTQGCS